MDTGIAVDTAGGAEEETVVEVVAETVAEDVDQIGAVAEVVGEEAAKVIMNEFIFVRNGENGKNNINRVMKK